MTQAHLVYFENWIDPVAERVLAAAPSIGLHHLRFAMPRAGQNAALAAAHG